uniref:Uncharacterized protein n=1 Tax=Moniliophthora roreri TaxID=221103 RepID=A0A0W0FEI9_MONRR
MTHQRVGRMILKSMVVQKKKGVHVIHTRHPVDPILTNIFG